MASEKDLPLQLWLQARDRAREVGAGVNAMIAILTTSIIFVIPHSPGWQIAPCAEMSSISLAISGWRWNKADGQRQSADSAFSRRARIPKTSGYTTLTIMALTTGLESPSSTTIRQQAIDWT